MKYLYALKYAESNIIKLRLITLKHSVRVLCFKIENFRLYDHIKWSLSVKLDLSRHILILRIYYTYSHFEKLLYQNSLL